MMSQPPEQSESPQERVRRIKRLFMRVASNCLVLAGAATLIWAFPKYQRGDVFEALMLGQVALFLMLLALWLRPW
ncbi:MAG: hypothetical protein J7M26_08605 [Armatimonadetes bacterium]|nr:hypothetical protein [Armatimonadota bacterium]